MEGGIERGRREKEGREGGREGRKEGGAHRDLEGGKERRREIEVGREGRRGRKEEQLFIVWQRMPVPNKSLANILS